MIGRREFLFGCACCSVAFSARAEESAHAPPLTVTPLVEGVWTHTSWKLLSNGRPFPSNGLIVKGAERTLIVDTTWPTQDMPALLDEAAVIAAGAPSTIAVTHAHDDRMSGLAIARERNVASLAFHLTQEFAAIRGLPPVDQVWSGRATQLDLGCRQVELFYPGPAHTTDNVVAFDERTGVLFGGCMIRTAADTALGNVTDADAPAWPASMRRLIDRYSARARIVVPGHGEAGGRELLGHTLALAEAAAGRASQ